MRKWLTFAFFSAFLSACSAPALISPAEEIENLPANEINTTEPQKETQTPPQTTSVKNKSTLYQCKGKKSVRVIKASENDKTVRVEFNQVSHTLSAALPKENKRKYSNIRWVWTEDFNGKAKLQNKSGKILAENCVKK